MNAVNTVQMAWRGVVDAAAPARPTRSVHRRLPLWVARTGLFLVLGCTVGALLTCTVLALLLIAGVSRGQVPPGSLVALAGGALLAALVSMAGGAAAALLGRRVSGRLQSFE